jgi:uncharacterized protein (DUF169 family)
MSYEELSQNLVTYLGLDTPPVALAFVDQPPAGAQVTKAEVPSACAFWRQAESEVFFAPAESHFKCPVGAMVMGFELPETVGQQLMGLVEDMCGCSYLMEDEASAIPTVSRRTKGIVYGPLRDIPLAPDLILMWLTPRQAMVWGEATGTSRWTDRAAPGPTGRPGCAALPVALGGERPTLSLGCAGMRIFTEISDDRLLAVLPGGRAEEIVAQLGATVSANESMESYYQGRKASLAS